MRLDHLLSKESTARAGRHFASRLGELLRRALANRPVDHPDPTSLSSARGTTGAGGVGHHCSVLREHAPSGRQAGTSASPGQRGTRARRELEVAVARGLCPPTIGRGARPRPLVENCRASTSIKNEEISQATKSQRWMPWRQMPMKDVGGCEKPREAADQAL